MRISCRKEIMEGEGRVALLPINAGVAELSDEGHSLSVERSAGVASGFTDQTYKRAGACIGEQTQIWETADILLGVKQPDESEFKYFREGLVVFCFLHGGANLELVIALQNSGVTAIDYGAIKKPNEPPHILAKMSEIAGWIACDEAADILRRRRQIMLGPGIRVLVLGLGTAGSAASERILARGARVLALDTSLEQIARFETRFRSFLPYQLWCLESSRETISRLLREVDIVIGATGRTKDKVLIGMMRKMKPGSIAIDISIDEGGTFKTSEPTSLDEPTIEKFGIIHYCVPNMPGSVPFTSTPALTRETFPYVLELANKGFALAASENAALARGVITYRGRITDKELACTLGLRTEYTPLGDLL